MAGFRCRVEQHQDQPATLLEHDISRTGEQIARNSLRDLAHGANRAGSNDHAHGLERPAGNGGPDIGDGIPDISLAAQLLRREIGFVGPRHLSRFGHDQVGLDAVLFQHLEQPDPVDHAGGATDANNQTLSLGHGLLAFCDKMTPIFSAQPQSAASQQTSSGALPEGCIGLLLEGVGEPGGLCEILPGGLGNGFGIGGAVRFPVNCTRAAWRLHQRFGWPF